MGVSLQQYRITIQTFPHSNIISYKSRKPKYRKEVIRKVKLDYKLLTSIILCLASWFRCNHDTNEKRGSHSPHVKLQYSLLICEYRPVGNGALPHHHSRHVPVDGDDDPPDPGEQVRWQLLDVVSHGGTTTFKNWAAYKWIQTHILAISQANFHSHHNLEDVQTDNYTLYLADTLMNPQLNISRVAVYVHKEMISWLTPSVQFGLRWV